MTTFDGWEAQLYGRDTLAHFRTKGSKNGVRRYQNPDGSWTPLGLKERKAREGWGESRKARRAEKKLAKAERRMAKREERNRRIAEYKEKKRQKSLKGLTDEELKNKIDRLKLENEYRELRHGPAYKAGVKIVKTILDYKAKKEERELERERNSLERGRLNTQRIQAIEGRKKAAFETKAAKYEAQKMASDVKGGLKLERKSKVLNSKTALRGTTIWGAIGKRANNRAKYIQENRMNAIEVKKFGRTKVLQLLQIDKEKQKTAQESHKADQEYWKSQQKKP